MKLLGVLAAIAGLPVVALLLLAVLSWASVWPAVLAAAATLLAALVLAWLWSHDLDVLTETLRRVGTDESAAPGGLWLPGMQRLGRATERLVRRVAARAALVEQLRRVDGAI